MALPPRMAVLGAVAALAATAAPVRAADPVIAAAGDIACGPAETGYSPAAALRPPTCCCRSTRRRSSRSRQPVQLRRARRTTTGSNAPSWGPAQGDHATPSPATTSTARARPRRLLRLFRRRGRPAPERLLRLRRRHLAPHRAQQQLRGPRRRLRGRIARGDLAEGRPEGTIPRACTLAFQPPAGCGPIPSSRSPLRSRWSRTSTTRGRGPAHRPRPPLRPLRALGSRSARRCAERRAAVHRRHRGRDLSGLGPDQPNSQVRDNQTFGVLKMTLHPSSYDWQFMPIAGQSFTDSGSRPCHGTGAAPQPPAPAPAPARPSAGAVDAHAERAGALAPGERAGGAHRGATRLGVASITLGAPARAPRPPDHGRVGGPAARHAHAREATARRPRPRRAVGQLARRRGPAAGSARGEALQRLHPLSG